MTDRHTAGVTEYTDTKQHRRHVSEGRQSCSRTRRQRDPFWFSKNRRSRLIDMWKRLREPTEVRLSLDSRQSGRSVCGHSVVCSCMECVEMCEEEEEEQEEEDKNMEPESDSFKLSFKTSYFSDTITLID